MLLCALCIGCGSDTKQMGDQKSTVNFKGHSSDVSYKVVEFEYDGCEYIAFGEWQTLAVTHKGNCKYCADKNGIKVK